MKIYSITEGLEKLSRGHLLRWPSLDVYPYIVKMYSPNRKVDSPDRFQEIVDWLDEEIDCRDWTLAYTTLELMMAECEYLASLISGKTDEIISENSVFRDGGLESLFATPIFIFFRNPSDYLLFKLTWM